LDVLNKKRRKRKNKPKIRTEEHQIFGGAAIIFRTPPSGNVWQFQMWLTSDQKYLRRSLRTKDISEAVRVAEDLYLDTRAKIRGNEAVFPKTMQELADEFLDKKKEEIGIHRTYGRWVTIRSQIKHVINFIGKDTKITEISQKKWSDYFIFRRDSYPNVVNTTLNNEKNTIRTLFRFAILRNYISANKLPELPTLKRESRKRKAFSADDWKLIYRFMRSNKWLATNNDKHNEQRQFIRDFALILINTGIRFGEARRLKWKNITILNQGYNQKQYEKSIKIELDASQTKNNQSRVVIGRRGDVFERIKKYSEFTGANDFVFADNHTGEQIVRDIYYKHWKYLVKETKLDSNRVDTTFYCLRHTYATWQLYAKTDVFTLAKNMGTSVKFIEDHYGQIKIELMREQLTKSFTTDKGLGYLIDNS
jgi:integrase